MDTGREYNCAVDFVDRNVHEGRGGKTAFVDPSRNMTYGELLDHVARIGPMLARFGVERENRIAMILLDTVEFPVLFWGAIRAGVVPVLLNTRLTVDQYRYLFEDSRAKVAFVSTALLPVVQEAAMGVETLKAIVVVGGGPEAVPRLDALLSLVNEPAAPARTCGDEVAYWLYSSGTTGNPKGVMHVHTTPMVLARHAGQERIGYREDDVIFSASKLFFAYGIGNAIFCSMWVGATSVFYPERPTPQTVFETLRGYQPTMFFGVPTLYAAILADPECTPERGSKSAEAVLLGRRTVTRACRPKLEGALRSRHRQRRRRDRVGPSLRHRTSACRRIWHGRRAGERLRTAARRRGGTRGRRRSNRRTARAGSLRRRRILESTRQVAAHFRGRVDTHRRQVLRAGPTAFTSTVAAPTTCSR